MTSLALHEHLPLHELACHPHRPKRLPWTERTHNKEERTQQERAPAPYLSHCAPPASRVTWLRASSLYPPPSPCTQYSPAHLSIPAPVGAHAAIHTCVHTQIHMHMHMHTQTSVARCGRQGKQRSRSGPPLRAPSSASCKSLLQFTLHAARAPSNFCTSFCMPLLCAPPITPSACSARPHLHALHAPLCMLCTPPSACSTRPLLHALHTPLHMLCTPPSESPARPLLQAHPCAPPSMHLAYLLRASRASPPHHTNSRRHASCTSNAQVQVGRGATAQEALHKSQHT